MSDFVYSSLPQPLGKLAADIKSIQRNKPVEISEYHGDWGSLAFIQNHYSGFQSVETQSHIVVIVGGPILFFPQSRNISDSRIAGTLSVYERWKGGNIVWDKDLSGPFVVLIIDKLTKEVICVTDLMMFIPVYQSEDRKNLVLGTHVDCIAKAFHVEHDYDNISITDFILNDVVTYPYTIYRSIRQCQPATVHHYKVHDGFVCNENSPYWFPFEEVSYGHIDEAASALRQALSTYIDKATDQIDEMGQFISGGEDSRAVTGLLPRYKKRHAFIFLESLSKEGEVAEKIAKIYGAFFNIEFRTKTYYLDILSEAVDLVGGGNQYLHGHSIGLVQKCGLKNFPAVFGGYLSDSLIKGNYSRKVWFHKKVPFFPEFFIRAGKEFAQESESAIFPADILDAVNQRRKEQMQRVEKIRPVTYNEWFVLWPATMRSGIPNFSSTRRLFRSYEPFMCSDVVKISAAVPITWKLNRRLFHKAMKPVLKPSWWVIHNFDGRFPYFSWWFNIPVQFSIWILRQIKKRMGMKSPPPWADWSSLAQSQKWKEMVQAYSEEYKKYMPHFRTKEGVCPFHNDEMDMIKKMNFMQVLYVMKKNGTPTG